MVVLRTVPRLVGCGRIMATRAAHPSNRPTATHSQAESEGQQPPFDKHEKEHVNKAFEQHEKKIGGAGPTIGGSSGGGGGSKMFLVLGGLAAAGGAYYYFFKKDVRDAKAKLDGKAAEIKTKVNYAIDDAKDAASRKIEGAKATVKEAAGNAAEQSSQYADAAAKKARDSLTKK